MTKDVNIARRTPRREAAPPVEAVPVSQVDADGFSPKVRALLERSGTPFGEAAETARRDELDQAQAGFQAALAAARGEPVPRMAPADPPPAAMEAMQASAARLAALETEAAAVTEELLRSADDPAGILKLRARRAAIAEQIVAARIIAAEASLVVVAARQDALVPVEAEASARILALKTAEQIVAFELDQATSAVGQVRGAQITQGRNVYRAEEAVAAVRDAAAGGAS
jgi:hypothetical protein